MRPRFVGRLGLADAITVANAAMGFLAAVAAPVDPQLAARLILLGGVADGLDGVVARRVGSTAAGEHLDSLSDVVSFGVAPGLVVATIAVDGWGLDFATATPRLVLALGVPALFLAMVVVRLGLYTAYDASDDHTKGVQSTLAATIVAAAVLAEVADATVMVALAAVLAYLMVTSVLYPDLLGRDAVIMGAVQTLAVFVPDAFGRAFPYALLTLAAAYLVFAPRFYWRPGPGAS